MEEGSAHTDVSLPKLPHWLKPLIFHSAQLLFLLFVYSLHTSLAFPVRCGSAAKRQQSGTLQMQ